MINGYPSGAVVLSITGNISAWRMYRIESGFTRPFSLSKNRKTVSTRVKPTRQSCMYLSFLSIDVYFCKNTSVV